MKFKGTPPKLCFEDGLSPELVDIGWEIINIFKESSYKVARTKLKDRFLLTEEDVNILCGGTITDFENRLKKVFGE